MNLKLSPKTPKVLLVIAALFLVVGSTYAKRSAPKAVPPVTLDGIKYSAPHFLKGKTQSGGFLQARDLKTDNLLWELRIYEVIENPKVEADVQDIFITSLKIVDKNLEVKNEKSDKFIVDLSARKVISGANRVYRFKDSGN